MTVLQHRAHILFNVDVDDGLEVWERCIVTLLTYYICKSLAEITNYIEGFCFSNIAFTSNSVIPFSLSLLKSLILR